MAVEAKRGCGYRRVGGLYIMGGGLSAPCDRMPLPLERCKTCGGGIKFTRGPQWLQPDFFSRHPMGDDELASEHAPIRVCADEGPCPVCRNRDDFGPHLLLWIGRAHYTPEEYLDESRRLGVSRRLSAMPKGLVLGETWVLLAHLDAVPAKQEPESNLHLVRTDRVEAPPARSAPTPGIFCAFIPRAVELLLKHSEATAERCEKEAKRGVTIVTVPDNDKDHQGSVWDAKDEEDSQPELPGVQPELPGTAS